MIYLRTEPILPITRMSTIRGSDGFVNRQSNRKTAQEATVEATAYDANNLNRYTAIQEGTAEAFVLTFDADGKAPDGCKGDWTNTECLPRRGEGAMGCARVNMGRRHTRKITVNGSVTNYLRYIYRGYLQIAAINAVSGVFQWFILWDPTQPDATRPLGIRKDGTWYTYGWDLTKNICESARRPRLGRLRQQAVRAIGQTRSVCPAGARSREAAPSQVFGSDGYIKTAYTYTPYGAVTANGNVTQSPRRLVGGLDKCAAFAPQGRAADGAAASQPIQWCSEYSDSEQGLIYYNNRYYSPMTGTWLGRDSIREIDGEYNRYGYAKKFPLLYIDIKGDFAMAIPLISSAALVSALTAAAVVVGGAVVVYAAGVGVSKAAKWVKDRYRRQKCKKLRRQKHEAKKAAKGQACTGQIPCKPSLYHCNEYLRRKKIFERLYSARKEYDDKCFDGSDTGHAEAITGARNAINTCNDMYIKCKKRLLGSI